jgi:hypothetical protein
MEIAAKAFIIKVSWIGGINPFRAAPRAVIATALFAAKRTFGI